MTDGILLTELHRDRQLLRYDTLIIDEAHERSLNIDFILGYLKRLLPRRPDLKVIITSATIDPQRFSGAFQGVRGTGHRGVRADLPGRGALPAAGRPGRSGRRAPGPGAGHPRRGGRTARRGARRHPGVPQRRAGDPGHRGRAGRHARPGGAAAVRPAVRGRAAPGVPAAPSSAGGAGHQRRGDLADRAGHPVRDRPGHRPDLPVQPADQGAAAADRADLAGLGQPAQGPLRPDRGRRVHPAVHRGGLRRRPQFTDPEILRTNLASVILRMAALRPGRHGRLPVRGPARIRGASPTGSGCSRNSGRSPPARAGPG